MPISNVQCLNVHNHVQFAYIIQQTIVVNIQLNWIYIDKEILHMP